MSDHIELAKGAPPWLPDHEVRQMRVLLQHGSPLAGLVQQHGSWFLYACIEGHAADWNAWVYAQLTDAEADRIARAPQPAPPVREALADNRNVIVAVAMDGRIVNFVHQPVPYTRAREVIPGLVVELSELAQIHAREDLRIAG